MKITCLPDELLCNILMFLSNEDYFNAIISNIFPVDETQYNKKYIQSQAIKKEVQNAINIREKSYRIRQGKNLIWSNFIPLLNYENQDFIKTHINEWDDEIDQYFLYDNVKNNGPATKILDFILNAHFLQN